MNSSHLIERDIKKRILRKLHLYGAFRKDHMLEENILKGIKRTYWYIARKALDSLVKEGLVKLYGKTKHGKAYQLNVDNLKQIETLIGETEQK